MDDQRTNREDGWVKPLLSLRKLLAAVGLALFGVCVWKAVQHGDWSYMAVGALFLIPIVSLVAARFTAQKKYPTT